MGELDNHNTKNFGFWEKKWRKFSSIFNTYKKIIREKLIVLFFTVLFCFSMSSGRDRKNVAKI